MQIKIAILIKLLFFALPSFSADLITQYCRMPDAERIIIRESFNKNDYEFKYWKNGQAVVSKGTFSYTDNLRRGIRFDTAPLSNWGIATNDDRNLTIVFNLNQRWAQHHPVVQFSKAQCPVWPRR